MVAFWGAALFVPLYGGLGDTYFLRRGFLAYADILSQMLDSMARILVRTFLA
jgi:hypothetical protein